MCITPAPSLLLFPTCMHQPPSTGSAGCRVQGEWPDILQESCMFPPAQEPGPPVCVHFRCPWVVNSLVTKVAMGLGNKTSDPRAAEMVTPCHRTWQGRKVRRSSIYPPSSQDPRHSFVDSWNVPDKCPCCLGHFCSIILCFHKLQSPLSPPHLTFISAFVA